MTLGRNDVMSTKSANKKTSGDSTPEDSVIYDEMGKKCVYFKCKAGAGLKEQDSKQ